MTLNLLQPEFVTVKNCGPAVLSRAAHGPARAEYAMSAYEFAHSKGMTVTAVNPCDARYGSLDDFHTDSMRLVTYPKPEPGHDVELTRQTRETLTQLIHLEQYYDQRIRGGSTALGRVNADLPEREDVAWGHIIRGNLPYVMNTHRWELMRSASIEPALKGVYKRLGLSDNKDLQEFAYAYNHTARKFFELFGQGVAWNARHDTDAVYDFLDAECPALSHFNRLELKCLTVRSLTLSPRFRPMPCAAALLRCTYVC